MFFSALDWKLSSAEFFCNALTETTFTDGDFGTIYRSFKFNEDSNTDPY